MKTLSLTIEAADLPPVYKQWADDESVADVDGGTYNFVSAVTCWAADAEQTTLTYSFAAGQTAVPSGAHLDSNGHVCCTFTTADAGTVYDFFVVATDSSGGYDQFRMVIPVIDSSAATPYVAEMGSWYCSVDENPDGEDPGGYLVFPVETITFPNPPSGQYPAARFAIDTYPSHGELTVDSEGIYYTPDEGFRGLDTFTCHLQVYDTVTLGDYPTEHNIAPEYIQVGSTVDLAPAEKYRTTVATDLQEPWWQCSRCVPVVDQAVLGVGATLTVTLTLQNPWGDGVPAAGEWTLDFDTAKVRVYEGQQEIVSSHWMGAGTRTTEYVVGSQETITLTVVAISAGAAPIQADWNVWNTNYAWPYPPSYCFGWTTRVDYAVVGADIDTDSNNDGYIDHASDDPVEDQYPGECLARYSGHPEELSEVDICSIGVTDPEAGLLTGKLTFSGDIRVWADRDRTQEIASGTQWDLYYTSQVPTAVYVEGETAGQSSMTWTVSTGATQLASDTVDFSLLTASLTVTDMAPLTILPATDQRPNSATAVHLQAILNQVGLPAGFDGMTAAITATEFDRGGDTDDNPLDGTWLYSPHNTYGTNSPWDPYYAYGTDPTGADGTGGGAAFFATVADGNGNRVKVNVTLGDAHSGYQFYHKSGSTTSANWVDQQATGLGGLLLVGGGDHPSGAYSWFGNQAAHGDIVVIGNKGNAGDIQEAVDLLFGQFGGAHAVDGFRFERRQQRPSDDRGYGGGAQPARIGTRVHRQADGGRGSIHSRRRPMAGCATLLE